MRTVVEKIKSIIAHPYTRDLSIDDPRTTERRRAVIQGNSFLRHIYDEWYSSIAARIPSGSGAVVEFGSGAGFLNDYVPDLIASEVFICPGISIVLDARGLPFAPASLKAIAMVDVLHHIPDADSFLLEAERCLQPGGALVMIEPWVSSWSRLIYTNLHHEPFDPEATDWTFPASGPLSGANGALPWIIFRRDCRSFEDRFPSLRIQEIRPFMPFRYLVSGGVSMRQLMPAATFGAWRRLESWFDSSSEHWAMFALIHVTRV